MSIEVNKTERIVNVTVEKAYGKDGKSIEADIDIAGQRVGFKQTGEANFNYIDLPKLEFDDLTQAQQDSLKLTFDQLTQAEKDSLKIIPKTPLKNWKRKILDSSGTAKMIFVGDSTSDFSSNASTIPTFVDKYTKIGGLLEGFDISNMPNFGLNGNTIKNFINNPSATRGIDEIIAYTPDLIIFSYGINDVRTNSLTREELKDYIIQAVEIFKTNLPETDILLRMPNSFVIPADETYIKQGNYTSLAEATQAQTDILYWAYKELENKWDDVIVWDSQNEIFGRTVKAESDFMTDVIHPNYSVLVEPIMNIIRVDRYIFNKKASEIAFSKNYAEPYLTYPLAVEDSDKYLKLFEGTLNNFATGSYLDVNCDASSNWYKVIKDSDIVVVGKRTFFRALNSTEFNPNIVRLLGNVPDLSEFEAGDEIVFYRSIYNHTEAAEPYLDNLKDYPYRRRVKLTAGNGYLRITSKLDKNDGLTKYTPNLNPSDYNLTSDDVLIAEGLSPLPLTNFGFSPNGTQLWFTGVSGDYSAYNNKIAYIFGNHDFEPYVNNQSGSFSTSDGKTVTFKNGVIVSVI